ncbi:MAG: hypothetical protein MHM6MM_002370 [Cercozoa sp. M6MM]
MLAAARRASTRSIVAAGVRPFSADIEAVSKRYETFNKLKQVCEAMQMVSSALAPKAQEMAKQANRTMRRGLDRWWAPNQLMYWSWKRLPWVREKRPRRHLFIAIAGDQGMCASANTAPAMLTGKYFQALKKEYPDDEFRYGCIGKRAVARTRFMFDNDDLFAFAIGGAARARTPGAKFIELVIDEIAQLSPDWIHVGSADFFEPWNMKVSVKQIPGYELARLSIVERERIVVNYNSKEGTLYNNYNYLYNKNLDAWYYEYLAMRLTNLIMNHRACEQTQRMQAMEGAVKNIRDELQRLMVTKNRLRQAQATESAALGAMGAVSLMMLANPFDSDGTY